MNITKIKKSRELWKDKALKKTREVHALRKEKARLLQSRALWKEKYKQSTAHQVTYSFLKSSDISRHSYSSSIIALSLSKALRSAEPTWYQQAYRYMDSSVRIKK